MTLTFINQRICPAFLREKAPHGAFEHEIFLSDPILRRSIDALMFSIGDQIAITAGVEVTVAKLDAFMALSPPVVGL